MPELPDIELYLTRIRERVLGHTLEKISIFNPFVLRTASPSPQEFASHEVKGVERIGKRVVLELDGDLFVVIHLMISGRFTWQNPLPELKRATGKIQLATIRFSSGQLTLQEASTKKRASIHLVKGKGNLATFNRGGLDVLQATPHAFFQRLTQENRTLKRALIDPTKFDGIGNAYSDEILFAAKLSPVRRTQALSAAEVENLRVAALETLTSWRDRLKITYPDFPKPAQITAFRPDFAVHGRFGKPCPVCNMPIQRIVYAETETNYCAVCQNEGRLLVDRSLSRLLKDDWPKTMEEMLGD